jgi:hypothetical protein
MSSFVGIKEDSYPIPMKRGLFPSWLRLFALGFMISGPVLAQSARVAVSGDPSLANLIDVTSSELSKLPELSVLDRADLNKLGQEQEIESVLNSQNFTPIQLLPADGLVLLRAATANGKTGVFARLVAVQPGIILREVALPDGIDPVAQAQTLEKEFAPYWLKLAAIQKGKVEALSLLGLRFEVDAPETRKVERRMTLLLASRLSAEPDVLVLERWRLNDAVFEKTLAPQTPSPFWTGSSLIDGSMQLKNGRINVTLRLRPPHGAEISITDQDTPENLPALVGRLADKIQNHPISPDAWKPLAEAAHYADLGKWCLDNGLTQEGVEAIESAVALGDTSRNTRMQQIKAYAMQAYPDNLRGNYLYDEFRTVIARDSVPQRIQAAQTAAGLMLDYLKDNHDALSPTWNPEGPIDLGVPVLCNCLRALRTAYEYDFQDGQIDGLAELRHDLQKLIGELDGQLLPQPMSPTRRTYLRYRDYYAGLWHDTPEQTVAYYREHLSPKMYGTEIRVVFYQFDGLHPPFLDDDIATDKDQESRLIHNSPAFRDTPFIAAWDGRPASDVRAIWRKFLDELAASPDPVLQADALKLELKSTLTDVGRNACVTRFVAFMQQHADLLSAPGSKPLVAGIDNFFSWTGRRDNADARRKLEALYLSLLKQHVILPPAWIDASMRFLYGDDKLTTDEARELLAAINEYATWYGSRTPQSPYDQQVLRALAQTRQIFFRARPELVPAPVETGGLRVTRFWSSCDQVTGTQIPRSLFIGERTLTVSAGHLWFMTQRAPYRIFEVDPATLQVISTSTIPDEMESPRTGGRLNVQSLDVSPQWLAAGIGDRFFLCSRVDNQWRQLELPPFIYKPRFVNQELYLLYHPAYDPRTNQPTSEGSGLIHVVLPAATIENVISSRRVPPQTALDGKPLGTPLDLWMTQGGLTLAVGADNPRFQAYATPVGKNDWTLLTSSPAWCDVRLTTGGALIGAGKTKDFFAQLSFLGAGGSVLLLANPDDAANYPPAKPLWNLPEEMRSSPPANTQQISAIMRGDDLVLYHNSYNSVENDKQVSLYYFARGQKDGVKIPLAFDQETLKNSRPGRQRIATPSLNFEGLQATDYGLIIYGVGAPGFWVIPWSNIDAYRTGTIPAPPSSAAAAISTNPEE